MVEEKIKQTKEKKSENKTDKKVAKPVDKKENAKSVKTAHASVSSAEQKIKQDPKMNELKIELLKQNSKKKDIRREIARLFTLQNKPMGENK